MQRWTLIAGGDEAGGGGDSERPSHGDAKFNTAIKYSRFTTTRIPGGVAGDEAGGDGHRPAAIVRDATPIGGVRALGLIACTHRHIENIYYVYYIYSFMNPLPPRLNNPHTLNESSRSSMESQKAVHRHAGPLGHDSRLAHGLLRWVPVHVYTLHT